MQAPFDAVFEVRTPGGLLFRRTHERTADADDPFDSRTLVSLAETIETNGQPLTRTYDGVTRTPVETTPEGRTRTIALDPQGRVASTQVTGLAPVTFGRDATGLLRTITAGRVIVSSWRRHRAIHLRADDRPAADAHHERRHHHVRL
jgi:hypothetical protein